MKTTYIRPTVKFHKLVPHILTGSDRLTQFGFVLIVTSTDVQHSVIDQSDI